MAGLENKVIISTRPFSKDDIIKEYLTEKGAVVLSLPLIEIIPSPVTDKIKYVLQNLDTYQWLVFTSKNGVDNFFRLLEELNIPEDLVIDNILMAAFGEKTTVAIMERGVPPVIYSTADTSEVLLYRLRNEIDPGDKVLLALGNLARNTFEEGLADLAEITRIDVYFTCEVLNYSREIIEQIRNDNYDIILFTSPSGFANFIKIMKDNGCFSDFRIACIGKTTEKEVLKHGYKPLLVSSKAEGLAFAREIEKYLSN